MIILIVHVPEPTTDMPDIIGPFDSSSEVADFINEWVPEGWRFEIYTAWNPNTWASARATDAPPASDIKKFPNRTIGRR